MSLRGVATAPAVRRRAVALFPLLALLALAGCAGIPERSDVFQGRSIRGGEQGLTQLFPSRPLPGASAVQLVQGFLRAAPDYSNDHEVARAYLAEPSRSWRPDESVIVYRDDALASIELLRAGPGSAPVPSPSRTPSPGTPSAASPSGASPSPGPRRPGPSPSAAASPSSAPRAASDPPPRVGERRTVRVTVAVEGRLDADGRYAPSAPGDREERTFDVVGEQVGASVQWRISKLADGLLITRYDFAVVFRDVPLYYPDASRAWLVPDVRWFPVAGTRSTPTLVVQALLAGPSPWLAPAVRTGARAGTRLSAFDAVRVNGGIATVDLTPEALAADPPTRKVLETQILASLQALSRVAVPAVTGLTLTVGGATYLADEPGSPRVRAPAEATATLRAFEAAGEPPLLLDAKGRVCRLNGFGTGSLAPVPGLERLPTRGAGALAAARDGSAYAVLLDGRRRLVAAVPAGPAVELRRGADLTAPSIDPQGWIWSAAGGPGGAVRASRPPDPAPRRITAPWLGQASVIALRVSGDGARALVLVHEGRVTKLYVSAVLRERGEPRALGAPLRLLPDLRSATDAVWADGERIVVLGRRSPDPALDRSVGPAPDVTPWVVQVGGEASTAVAAVAEGRTVAAGPGGQPIYIGTAGGHALLRSGATWRPLRGARLPTLPG